MPSFTERGSVACLVQICSKRVEKISFILNCHGIPKVFINHEIHLLKKAKSLVNDRLVA